MVGHEIKRWNSGTITANTSGAATKETPNMYGELRKVAVNYGTAAAGTDVTIANGDTPAETVVTLADQNTDLTMYPKVLAVTSANGALTATGNIYTYYAVAGPLTITVADAGSGGTLDVTLYWRE